MRRIALFLFPLLLLACSKEKEDASVFVSIGYTESFKTGCIVMRAEDSADPTKFKEERFVSEQLQTKSPPLTLGIAPIDGWGRQWKLTVRAHEQDCSGKLVDEAVVPIDLTGTGRKPMIPMSLTTPDEDGDGFVATSTVEGKGGTDCDDRNRQINILAEEICDDIDNSCAGEPDKGLLKVPMFQDKDGDGFGGEAIMHCVPVPSLKGYSTEGGDCNDENKEAAPGKTEVCDGIDNNCLAGIDEGFDKNWYLDNDGDGVPASAVTEACDSPGPKYMHFTEATFDCDDADAGRYPGNAEICDGIDNNCTGVDGNTIDENFPTKGNECFTQGCRGMFICNVSNPEEVTCSAQAPRKFYPDLDGDLDGDATVPAQDVCAGVNPPVGHVENDHGDCDDKDSARSSRHPEVCDSIDNNCRDGVTDEPGSCGGTLKQVNSYHLTSDNQDWRTVAVHPSGYPVWVAGRAGKLALRRSPNAVFESFSHGDPTAPPPTGTPPVSSNNCGSVDWTASWVDSNGRVILGGTIGTLAIHDGSTTTTCATGGTSNTANVSSLVGFEANGVTTVFVTDTDGRFFRWVLGGPVSELNDYTGNLYGVHGLREDFLLAVGGITGGGGGQRVRSYAVTPSGGTPTAHTLSSNVAGNAKAVWMGSDTTACAVGDNGAVWRWDGGINWNKEAVPGGVTVPFTSVVMRNHSQSPQQPSGHCYMVDGSANGKLRRMTPLGWGTGPVLDTNVPLNDIAITATGEIWIAGEDGRVFHYPEP